jgi:hypothetical protein
MGLRTLASLASLALVAVATASCTTVVVQRHPSAQPMCGEGVVATAQPPVAYAYGPDSNADVSVAPLVVPPTASPRASSSYNGWGVDRLLDGDPTTSWFSASGDSLAHGKTPWIELSLSAPTRLRRITILGNREPSWKTGYSVEQGVLDLFDANGQRAASAILYSQGEGRDFVFVVPDGLRAIATMRFTALKDEGGSNPYGDVAIAEVLIEPVGEGG